MGGVERHIVNLIDHIAGLQSSLRGRAARRHTRHINAPLNRQAIGGGDIRRNGLVTDSKIRMRYISFLDDLRGNGLRGVDRDRESQSFRDHSVSGVADNQFVDADHFTREINQRSARVALIDRCVGLNQTFDLVAVTGVDGTSGRADHANGHGVLEITERRTNRNRGLSGFEQIRISQRRHYWDFPINLQNGDIGIRISADERCFLLSAIGQDDIEVLCILDHMIVGEDVTLIGNEKAAAADGLSAGRTEECVLSGNCADHCHDRRSNFLNGLSDTRFEYRSR